MLLPLSTVNLPLKPKGSAVGLAGAAAMARPSRIQSQLTAMHTEPLAPVREGSRSSMMRASMARPPNLPVGRPSAVGSVISEASSWSLEQSAVEDDLLSCRVPEDATERLNLGPQGLREHYRRKSSKIDVKQAAKAAKARGSMRVSIHPQAAAPLETQFECSASETITEPAESEASAHTGAPPADTFVQQWWHGIHTRLYHRAMFCVI